MRVAAVIPYEGPAPDVYDLTVEPCHAYRVGTAGVWAHNSKRISLLDVNALLSHGATATLRDAGAYRGQKNDDLWLRFMSGHDEGEPRVPFVYEKFVEGLKSAGINVLRRGSKLHVLAMTNSDVDRLSGGRRITTGDTVDWSKGLDPIKGGLFDPTATGGHNGRRWSAVELHEPMPNPVMEEPVRRLLNLTGKQFEEVVAGRRELQGGGTGPKGIAAALGKINVPRELAIETAKAQSGSRSSRDQAVRRLEYLKGCERTGLDPKDWVLKLAPVLPPAFRPVSTMGTTGQPLVSDPNYLYRELIEADANLKQMTGLVGEENVGDERLAVYRAFKAVTGLGDPIGTKTQEKKVGGVLKHIFGSAPKFGTVQRKLISSTVDNVGRAVITPDPDLDMDEVGLPEDRAYDVYSRYVVRRLVRQGMPVARALEEVKLRSPLASKALDEEMEHRPVIVNRAPVLHRFGIMAFRPKRTKGSTLRVSPLVTKGFNADFDGDAMQYHVPWTEDARKEALERMLPSRNLFSPSDFKSPVHSLGQEYVGGLYHASTHRTGRTRTFRSAADALEAWQDGGIDAGDKVKILE